MKHFVKKATRYGPELDMKTFYTQWNLWSLEMACPFPTIPHLISAH